jgi:hypothetical protein
LILFYIRGNKSTERSTKQISVETGGKGNQRWKERREEERRGKDRRRGKRQERKGERRRRL